MKQTHRTAVPPPRAISAASASFAATASRRAGNVRGGTSSALSLRQPIVAGCGVQRTRLPIRPLRPGVGQVQAFSHGAPASQLHRRCRIDSVPRQRTRPDLPRLPHPWLLPRPCRAQVRCVPTHLARRGHLGPLHHRQCLQRHRRRFHTGTRARHALRSSSRLPFCLRRLPRPCQTNAQHFPLICPALHPCRPSVATAPSRVP